MGNVFEEHEVYYLRWNGKKPEGFDDDLWEAIDEVITKHGLNAVMERD